MVQQLVSWVRMDRMAEQEMLGKMLARMGRSLQCLPYTAIHQSKN